MSQAPYSPDRPSRRPPAYAQAAARNMSSLPQYARLLGADSVSPVEGPLRRGGLVWSRDAPRPLETHSEMFDGV